MWYTELMKQINAQRWFPIVIEKDEDGFLLQSTLRSPAVICQGKTIEEAIANVQEATELCLGSTDK